MRLNFGFILAVGVLIPWLPESLPFESDPCSEGGHTVINNPHRSTLYQARSPSELICDNVLTPAWYRFKIYNSPAKIPTKCTPVNHCGTQASVWHNVSSNKACVTWFTEENEDCCSIELPLDVRQCDGFSVYFLHPTPGCNMAFCAEQDGFKDMTQEYSVRLSPDVFNSKFRLNCQVTPQPKLGSRTKFVWYKTDRQGLQMIIRDTTKEGGTDSLYQKNHFAFGDSIVCEAEIASPAFPQQSVPVTLSSEAFTVGLSVSPRWINVTEGEQKTVVTVTANAAHICRGQKTSCKITFAVKEKGSRQSRPSNIAIQPCFVTLDASSCSESHCGQGTFTVSVKSDYFQEEADRKHEIMLEPQSFNDPLWVSYEPEVVAVQVKGRLPSYCYSTLSHVITETDVQDIRQNVGVLYKDEEFEIYVQLRRCDPTAVFRCICGVFARDSHEIIQITNCESHLGRGRSTAHNDEMLEITYEQLTFGPAELRIFESKKGSVLTVEFPSGPILRLHNKGDSGLAVSLRLLPEKRQSQGLCTNSPRDTNYQNLKAVLDDIKAINTTHDYLVSSQPSIETNQELHSRTCGSEITRWMPLLYGIDMTHDVVETESLINQLPPLILNGRKGRKEQKVLEPQGNGVAWKVKSRRENRRNGNQQKKNQFGYKSEVRESEEIEEEEEQITKKPKVIFVKNTKGNVSKLSRKLRNVQSKLFTIFSDFYEEEIIPIIPEENDESNELQYGGYEPETKSKNFVSVTSALNDKEISLALRCSALILDTPIINECADFLADFVMRIVNFCVANYHRIMKTSSLPNLIAFLEDHCEAKVVENFTNFTISGKDSWEPPKNIKDALNCPAGCSGHGICLDFGCICDPGFFGDGCSKMTEKPPRLEGHVICDLGKGICSDIRLDGSGFINTTELSCRQTVDGDHLEPVKALYISSKMIRCSIGTNVTGVYEFEVSNNLNTWSSSVQVTVINSACQKCSYHGRKMTCLERADVCRFENTCVPHGSHNPNTPCLKCNAKGNVREWQNVCDDPCDPNPCFDDVECRVVGEGEKMEAKCGVCPPGMEGDGFECDDANDCASNPCYPGVECFDHAAPMVGFSCGPCPEGLKGDGIMCTEIKKSIKKEERIVKQENEIEVDKVKVEMVDRKTGKKRKCLEIGTCDKRLSTSAPICNRECQNGGKCIGNNVCACTSGFRGKYCEKSICKLPCLNKGHCIAPGVCRCQSGWTGLTCGVPICRPTCANGGVCISPGVCACPEGTTGRFCESIICTPPCQNGGVCNGKKNKCECPAGFTGKDCSTRDCTRSCRNGGLCLGNVCSCPPGYSGLDCEIFKCRRKCRNGGICAGPDLCKCVKPFKGQFCQHRQKKEKSGKKKKQNVVSLLNLTGSGYIT